MTVATSVLSTSSFASRIARASTARIRSPSTSAPDRVDGEAAVGVAVVRDARSAPCFEDRPPHEVEVGGTDPVVDVQPVGLGGDRDDLGARAAVDLRRDGRRGAVRAVDDHAQPVERGRGGDEQVVGVAGVGVVGQVADPADTRPGRAGADDVEARLDGVLHGIGQLVATRGEELDAVVGHGVVRRGDHHAEVGVERLDQVRDGRGGQHADPDRVGARRGEPGDDRGLQHLPAGPRVAADHGDRAVRTVALGQHVRGRRGERHGELRGEHLAVGEPAHAVGAEQTPSAHGQRLLY